MPALLCAGVGDPQLRTNHPWYPGELACSTFDRLWATESELYQRVVGRAPATDEERVIAAWLWRNTHYFHGESGGENLWGTGFQHGDTTTREYWTGLFAHGFGLCGTTHAQWTAEMEQLLGHNRARVVGTTGHNSFEVYLTDGPYLPGEWALLDHDLSTIIFDGRGEKLLSIPEVIQDQANWIRRDYLPQKQQGWLVCGLHPGDGAVYDSFRTAEYLAGYGGPPPLVYLRRGESLRRYLEPGLDDGRTFVFWGRNSKTGDIPGPERSITWVNQPEKMYRSNNGAGYQPGQARYGNAVYQYTPDFESGDYREGVVGESNSQVVFEFYSPYIIGCTPPNDEPWGIYDAGGRNGLVIEGNARCAVSLSVDQGQHWQDAGVLSDRLDLTDFAKGYRQYLLRFAAGAEQLRGAGIRITTVCQANAATMPRLVDGETTVQFAASNRGLTSAGPTIEQARAHLVEGAFDSPVVAMSVTPPRGEKVVAVYAAAHVRSSNPPDPDVHYAIDMSQDGGATRVPLVDDWRITLPGQQPSDFWSQSFCWAARQLEAPATGPVQVRFTNNGGKTYARAELHAVYQLPPPDRTLITFAWSNSKSEHQQQSLTADDQMTWTFPTGENVKTRWIEMRPLPR